MNAATENLLRELDASPTDLKRLVISAFWRNRTAIAIEAEAIARWERDDPRSWSSVQDWLLSQNITITVLQSRPSPPPYHLLPPPPTHAPPLAHPLGRGLGIEIRRRSESWRRVRNGAEATVFGRERLLVRSRWVVGSLS